MIQKDIEVLKDYVEFGEVNAPLRTSVEQVLMYVQYLEYKLEDQKRKEING